MLKITVVSSANYINLAARELVSLIYPYSRNYFWVEFLLRPLDTCDAPAVRHSSFDYVVRIETHFLTFGQKCVKLHSEGLLKIFSKSMKRSIAAIPEFAHYI